MQQHEEDARAVISLAHVQKQRGTGDMMSATKPSILLKSAAVNSLAFRTFSFSYSRRRSNSLWAFSLSLSSACCAMCSNRVIVLLWYSLLSLESHARRASCERKACAG